MLEKDGNPEHLSFTGPDAETSLDAFLSFHREKKCCNDRRFYSLLQNFVSRCKDRDWVQIDMLLSNGTPSAALFHFRYADALYQYIMVTDKSINPKVSIGNILIGFCIEGAINKGLSAYDFLKGTEDFKFSWTGTGKSSLTFFLPQKKILPWIFAARNFVKAAAKIALR